MYKKFDEKFIVFIFLSFCGIIFLLFKSLVILTIAFAVIVLLSTCCIFSYQQIKYILFFLILFLLWGAIFYFACWQDVSIKKGLALIPAPFNLRNIVLQFLESKKTSVTASYLQLIIFNSRPRDLNPFYFQLIDLGIVHLISVSGFHLSILSVLIKKACGQKHALGNFLSFLTCLFYGYFLGMGFAILRVVISSFLSMFKNSKTQNDPLYRTVLSGCIVLLINPFAVYDIGFQLTYFGTIVLCFLLYLKNLPKIMLAILASLIINFLSAPIIFSINHKINLLIIFNSWIFTPVISFYYLFSLALLPFWFIWDYFDWLYLALAATLNYFHDIKFYWYLKSFHADYIYLLYYSVFFIIALIWSNKMHPKKRKFLINDHNSFIGPRLNSPRVTKNSW